MKERERTLKREETLLKGGDEQTEAALDSQREANGMRVLITDATGFLGRALARSLARGGAEVHALGRPTADRSALDGVAVIWHEGDVTVPTCDSLAAFYPRMHERNSTW